MSNNMTKAELIGKVAQSSTVSKAVSEKVINAVIQNIEKALSGGKTVTLVGFGTFTTTQRKARKGRNPQTGKEINIAASTVPKFRPGKNLRDAVKK